MSNTNPNPYIIVTEEQAAQFEAAGVPVELQYMVRAEHLVPKAPKPEATVPVRVAQARTIRFPHQAPLRWTGLKWTGGEEVTQARVAYDLLHAFFKVGGAKPIMTRKEVSVMLARELPKKGVMFSSSLVTYLCKQKYLEMVGTQAKLL